MSCFGRSRQAPQNRLFALGLPSAKKATTTRPSPVPPSTSTKLPGASVIYRIQPNDRKRLVNELRGNLATGTQMGGFRTSRELTHRAHLNGRTVCHEAENC